jgi:uncharacterized protein YbjT (DUF2867 family)
MEVSDSSPFTGHMSSDNTLVLGGTGKTGRRIAARLRLHGIPVRAVARTTEIPFDWSDPGTWNPALQGVSAAYIVAPPLPRGKPGPAHDFVAQAENAGVRRLVLLSGRGADNWGDSAFGLDMRDAEDAVRSSGLEWTVLRPNNFAQNFDEELWHAPLIAGHLALPAGEVPEPFIDLEDVADVATVVLTEPGRHAGQVYELSGPRSVTFEEAVQLISRAADLPIAYKQISADEYAAGLAADGLSEDDAHHVAEMFVLMERGLIAETTDGVATVLGRPPRTFEDYVLRTAVAGAWRR